MTKSRRDVLRFDFKVKKGLEPLVISRVKRLRSSLQSAFSKITVHVPDVYPNDSFEELRFRIFPFPERERNQEYFMQQEGMQYVCLDSRLVRKDFYTSFEYLVHGIGHSFSVLEQSGLQFGFFMEETFCEMIGYRACTAIIRPRSVFTTVIRRLRRNSPADYNKALDLGEAVERLHPNFFAEANSKLYRFASRNERVKLRKLLHRQFLDLSNRVGVSEDELLALQARLRKDVYQEFEADFVSV